MTVLQETPQERRYRVVGFPHYKVFSDVFEVKKASEIIFDIEDGPLEHDPILVQDDVEPEADVEMGFENENDNTDGNGVYASASSSGVSNS